MFSQFRMSLFDFLTEHDQIQEVTTETLSIPGNEFDHLREVEVNSTHTASHVILTIRRV